MAVNQVTKPLDKVLAALEAHDCKPKNIDANKYEALCPAHDDHTASLSITESSNGAVLLKCFAGCIFGDIVSELGLKERELFSPSGRSGAEIIAKYNYTDEAGVLIFQVCRTPDKKFLARRPDGKDGWIWNIKKTRRVLYQLPEIIKKVKAGEVIWICEGEKDCDNLWAIGMAATCNPGGIDKWKNEYSEFLRDACVMILPDNDEQGRKHAQDIAQGLNGIAHETKVLELPNLPEKGDVSDFLQGGGSKEKLLELAKEAPIWTPKAIKKKQTGKKGKLTQGEVLTRICEENVCEFLQDQYGIHYVLLPFDNHRELWPVSHGRFRERWLARLYREQYGNPPNTEALKQARIQVQAICDEKPKRTLYNRVAWHESDLYYDLTNDKWQAVKITEEGWEVVLSPPIFRRYKHQSPQVNPEDTGNAKDLFEFCNVAEDDQCLFLTTIASYFIPDISHPTSVQVGEQGSGKSTNSRQIKSLVDPSTVPLLSKPKDLKAAHQLFEHHWVAPLDNISGIPEWLSDCICRCVTGGGSMERELYTDNGVFIRSFRRCVIINGIGLLVYRPDLLDRSVIFETPLLARYFSEDQVDKLWDAAKPGVLGAIFTAISEAIKVMGKTVSTTKFRMADFACWGLALAEPLGFTQEQFEKAYCKAIEEKWQDAVEASVLGQAIIDLVDKSPNKYWKGTPSELLEALPITNMRDEPRKGMPQNSRTLGRDIKTLAPVLRSNGINVYAKRGKERNIYLSREKMTENGLMKW